MKIFLEVGSCVYKIFEKRIFTSFTYTIFLTKEEVLNYLNKNNIKEIQVIPSGYFSYIKLYKNKNINNFYIDYLQYSNFKNDLYYIESGLNYKVYSYDTSCLKFLDSFKYKLISLVDWYSILFKDKQEYLVLDFGHTSTRMAFYKKNLLFYKEIPMGGLQLSFLLQDTYSLQLQEAQQIKESSLYSDEIKKIIEEYYESLLIKVFEHIPKNVKIFIYGQEIKNKILYKKYKNFTDKMMENYYENRY